MDRRNVLEGGHRLRAQAGVVYSPFPELGVGLDLQGHLDDYPELDVGDSVKLYGEPRLALRYARPATPRLHWGVELDARFVGADAPSIEPSATSPSVRGLVAFRAMPKTWLAAELGFHLDRSGEAVPDPTLLGSADKRTLGASSFNAVPWGLGVSHRLAGPDTELLGELGGSLLVGAGKPKASRFPTHLGFGVRHPLSPMFSLLGSAEVALSRRPLTMLGEDLIPIEPRVSVNVGLVVHLGLPEPAAPPPPPEEQPPKEPEVVAPPPAPVPPPATKVSGSVVEEGGRPLPDAEVTLEQEGQAPLTTRTDAEGHFEFESIPEGPLALSVTSPGYDPTRLEVAPAAERGAELVLHPAVPAGQVRGRVTNLSGEPLVARVVVEPGSQEVPVAADGSFELELAPGSYTVSFVLEGYRGQKRKITLKNRGVVILNIALSR